MIISNKYESLIIIFHSTYITYRHDYFIMSKRNYIYIVLFIVNDENIPLIML